MRDPGSNFKVLIVEDEYFLADDLAQALHNVGATVLGPVASLNDAMQFLDRGEAIDFAVLDVNLRGENVFPFAGALRDRGVPFIFATGYDQVALPGTYSDVIRLEKPLDPDQVTKLVVAHPGAQ